MKPFTIIKNAGLVPTEFAWPEVQTRSDLFNGKALIAAGVALAPITQEN